VTSSVGKLGTFSTYIETILENEANVRTVFILLRELHIGAQSFETAPLDLSVNWQSELVIYAESYVTLAV
jgi:hypothetical protein